MPMRSAGDLNTLAEGLGYQGLEDMLRDNPGMLQAVLAFAVEEGLCAEEGEEEDEGEEEGEA